MRRLGWSIGRWWSAAVSLAAVGPVLLAPLGPAARAAESGFTQRVVDPHAGEICYAVTLADVDGDGRQDIVVVTERAVLWYAAPALPDGAWQKHTVIHDQTPRDNVCIAAHDIDGDGQIDFALGASWPTTGTLHWLSRGNSLDEP